MFTFLLKWEGRRLYLVGFSPGAVEREVFEEAIANVGAAEEVLTDQGPQYRPPRARRGLNQGGPPKRIATRARSTPSTSPLPSTSAAAR